MSELDESGELINGAAAGMDGGGRFRKAAEAVLSAERLAVDRAGDFYRHDGQHWKRLTRVEIEALIFQHTKFVRSRSRSEVLKLMRLIYLQAPDPARGGDTLV